MYCPRCQNTTLFEREREGIVIDVCQTCRGVWLDRGELEKLVARETREMDDRRYQRDSTPPRPHKYEGDHYDARRHPKRKRSWLESLGDVFD